MSEAPRPERDDQDEVDEDEVDIDALLRELSEEGGAEASGVPLFPVVIAALDERGWNYQADAEHTQVHLTLKGEAASFAVRLLVNESWALVNCYVQLPVWVPEERRSELCEAIARASYGLPTACFEMDLRDGELRCRSGVDVERGLLSTTMVHNLIGACMSAADRYHPAFMRILYGGITPEAAIAEAEG